MMRIYWDQNGITPRGKDAIKTVVEIVTVLAIVVMTIKSGYLREVTAEEYIWDSNTYLICDVVDSEWEIGRAGTETEILSVAMPNGEIHTFRVSDAPEGVITEVALKTSNQDDYSSYEVVAVR